jgi:phosphohistidine phosphatase SixA
MQYRLIGIILAILFSFSALPPAHAQEVVYLIRHAEQVLDVEDPPLREAGHQRAKAWAAILRDANIKVIYTSKKRRTKQTGEPVAQALNIPLQTMPRRDVAGLVDRLRTRHADEAVLIVGHSRTVPKLIRELGYSEDVTIERDDYDNLFIVVPQSESAPIVMRLRYE